MGGSSRHRCKFLYRAEDFRVVEGDGRGGLNERREIRGTRAVEGCRVCFFGDRKADRRGFKYNE